MLLYIATFWDSTVWTDLHTDPLSFKDAQDKMMTAMLEGRGTTRLRLATPPEISAAADL
ncbi:hypothetical protein PANO111632_15650 [Paracoccus nototheniae]|uniref:Uncharacterized protein n=1 Tax=Paracoccus nototheniae TaxID=2489002 RepID=A0ABW4E027_9RHOB|nr:hypothetical protein [Paracoccus nototheniae]